MDENRIPETIHWNAADTTISNKQNAKAFILSLWDGTEKTALRIDLWTKDMMMDEMTDFFYQTIMTMADTYGRSTKHNELVEEMKKFARNFYENSRKHQLKEHKA